MANELENVAKVLGRGETIKLGGAEFYIRPFRFGQLPKVINLFTELADLLGQHGANLVTEAGEGGEVSINIIEAFKLGADVVFGVLKLALAGQEHKFIPCDIVTGEPLPDAKPISFDAFFETEVDPAEGLALANLVWGINKNFFEQKVVPMMTELLNSIGSTFANASSVPDTTLTESPTMT